MALEALGCHLQPVIRALNSGSFYKPSLLPVRPPEGFAPTPATSQAELNSIVARLQVKEREWQAVGIGERAELIRACVDTTLQAAEPASVKAEKVKGSYGAGHGEEYLGWFTIVWGVKQYADTLAADARPKPNRIRRRTDGQAVVEVFPNGLEALLFGGMKGELWLQPGSEPTQGALYRSKQEGKARNGSVALVLGAGNQASVVCYDILHMLLVEDSVVICKMNPVNEYLGPFIRQAFLPLVEAGYLEIVYGSASEGEFLTNHPDISSIHLTGSTTTYDAIVWGKHPKTSDKAPPCQKRVTAELGCVTPYIIVPGKWTHADMVYHANEIVAGLINNSGHNCTKVEVLVTDGKWEQRDEFIEVLRDRLNDEPDRIAWYPGSAERLVQAKKSIPGLLELGRRKNVQPNAQQADHAIPNTYEHWQLSTGLLPHQAQTQKENWVGVLQEVALPGTEGNPQAFLPAAVEFCNRRCWGSLSAAIIVHPDVQKTHSDVVEKAVADLRYGSVTVNAPSFVCYALPYLAWGAYPGNQPHDIGSGNCFVHNVQMYDHVQKSVMWSPWRTAPTHFYDSNHRNLTAAVRACTKFVAYPNIWNLSLGATAALRG